VKPRSSDQSTASSATGLLSREGKRGNARKEEGDRSEVRGGQRGRIFTKKKGKETFQRVKKGKEVENRRK